MPGGECGDIRTQNKEINSFLDILSDDDQKNYWPWAKEQLLKRACGMHSITDKLELLEAIDGILDFTSMGHFEEIREYLTSILD